MDDKPKNKFLNMNVSGDRYIRIRSVMILYMKACFFPSLFLGSVGQRGLVLDKGKEISKIKGRRKKEQKQIEE